MDRLTERDEYGNADIVGVDSMVLQGNLSFDEFNRVTEALNRLAHYEDLEEQGRLVILPCKVGALVYWLDIRGDRAAIVCKHFKLTDAEKTKKMWGKLAHPTKESAILCLKENGYDDYFDVSHVPVRTRIPEAEAALAAASGVQVDEQPPQEG